MKKRNRATQEILDLKVLKEAKTRYEGLQPVEYVAQTVYAPKGLSETTLSGGFSRKWNGYGYGNKYRFTEKIGGIIIPHEIITAKGIPASYLFRRGA